MISELIFKVFWNLGVFFVIILFIYKVVFFFNFNFSFKVYCEILN